MQDCVLREETKAPCLPQLCPTEYPSPMPPVSVAQLTPNVPDQGLEDHWWAYSLPISLLLKRPLCDTWAFATQGVLDPSMRHYSRMHILQARLLDEARGRLPCAPR